MAGEAENTATEQAPNQSVESLNQLITSLVADTEESREEDTAAAGTAAGASVAKPAAAGAAAAVVDPLDEAAFTDEALTDPAKLRAARELIKAERIKANELRKKAQNAHAAAENREAKFKRTKDQVLADKQGTAATVQMIGAHIAAMRSGDPEQFLRAVQALSQHPEPAKFWREVSVKLATGGKGVPGDENQALLDRIALLERRLSDDGAARARSAADAEIASARAEQVAFAREYAQAPLVQRLTLKNPRAADDAIMAVKTAHYERTGRPIDTAAACGILESELTAQLELLQPSGDPNGDPNGKRGDAAPEADPGQVPGAFAKPGTAQRPPPRPQPPTTIPQSLSAEPAAARRALSKKEQQAADVKALDELGFFKQIGM